MLIVKVPGINGLGKTKGCEKTPNVLVEKLKSLKLKNKVKEIKVDNSNVEESKEKIYEESLKILKKNKREKIIFIGGDHSISYSTIKAFSKVLRKKKKYLVVFDAHADCMKPMKEPTHEEWLRAVIEEKLVDKVFLIGTRKVEPEENKFLEEMKKIKKIKLFTIKDLKKNMKKNLNLFDCCYGNNCEIYLTIDIDVFDPSIAPGTGYLEKEGMTTEEFFNLIKKIKKIKAIDLVEINPEKDLNNKTVSLALDIIKKLKY